MAWLVFALGGILSIAGAAAVGFGAEYIELERGWTEVIAGTVALSGGIVTVALACVLVRLAGIRRALTAGLAARAAEPWAAAPVPARAAAVAVPAAFDEPEPEPEVHHAHPASADEAAHREPEVAMVAVAVETVVIEAAAPEPPPAAADEAAEGGEPPIEPAMDEPLPEPDSQERSAAHDVVSHDAEPAHQASEVEAAARAAELVDAPPAPPAPDPEPGEEHLPPATEIRPRAAAGATPADWLEQALTRLDETFELGAEPAHSPPEPERIARPPEARPAEALAKELERLPPSAPKIVGRYSAGGVSYALFFDGSIEADTPNGTFHFRSMQELKTFIEEQAANSAAT